MELLHLWITHTVSYKPCSTSLLSLAREVFSEGLLLALQDFFLLSGESIIHLLTVVYPFAAEAETSGREALKLN